MLGVFIIQTVKLMIQKMVSCWGLVKVGGR